MDVLTQTDLSGKVALVTGASRGIGHAVALAYAKRGAILALLSQSDKIKVAAEKIAQESSHTDIISFVTDISKPASVQQVVFETIDRFGQIDVLVNSAGVLGAKGPLAENNPVLWAQTIQVNLMGTFHTMRYVLPEMIKRKRGSVINFSGGGAASSSPNFSAYGCSKAAVVRLTETTAQEVSKHNIRVNVIAPGANQTDMLKEFIEAGGKARTFTTMDKPVGLALFLASDRSEGLNGRFLHVNDDWENLVSHSLSPDLFTLRRVEK